MSKPTAVQWLIKELKDLSFTSTFAEVYYTYNLEKLCEQAKQMEKEQIQDAYQKGRFNGQTNWGYGNDITAEQYYNETFGGETD